MVYLDLSGSDFEIGYQQGRALKDSIEKVLDRFSVREGKCWITSGWKKEELEKAKDKLLSLIEKYAPGIIEEIRGISEGSKISLADITLWNLISDIGYLKGTGCSVIILPQSEDGPILAQNLDLSEREGNPQFLKKVSLTNGLSFLCTGWIGTFWVHNFLSSYGLASGGVSGPTPKHIPEEGISGKALGWLLVRNYRRMEEVINYYLKTDFLGKVAGNNCFLDKGGEGVVIDRLYSHQPQEFRRSNKEPIFAPVGFDSAKMKEAIFPRTGAGYYITKAREKNIEDLLKEVPLNIGGIKKILRNHNIPGAVCRHNKNDGSNSNTTYSVIMLPNEGKILLADGLPCKNEYKEYKL